MSPEEARVYQCSSRDVQKEKSIHRNWQWNSRRIAVNQGHATRRALLPPLEPERALAWRRIALWRAQKLGWADVRHARGLLLGPLLEAAARITLLEFGLDPDKGDYNGILLRQLMSIDSKHWNDFMEVGWGKDITRKTDTSRLTVAQFYARVEVVSDRSLKEAPKDIEWLTPEEAFARLEDAEEMCLSDAEKFLSVDSKNPSCDPDKKMLFTRPGALEYGTFMALIGNFMPALRSCTTEGPYEH